MRIRMRVRRCPYRADFVRLWVEMWWYKRSLLFWDRPFSEQAALSENKPLPSETMMANEGPSYSSQTSTIDLWAKVMPLSEIRGCLQQLQCVPACCMCVTAMFTAAPLRYNLSQSQPFFFQSPSDTFHPFPSFNCLSRFTCVRAQNTEQYTSFCIYHTCTCSPLARHQTERAIWFAFLSRDAERLWPLLSTYEMKSDAGDACLWKLESLNRVQE